MLKIDRKLGRQSFDCFGEFLEGEADKLGASELIYLDFFRLDKDHLGCIFV